MIGRGILCIARILFEGPSCLWGWGAAKSPPQRRIADSKSNFDGPTFCADPFFFVVCLSVNRRVVGMRAKKNRHSIDAADPHRQRAVTQQSMPSFFSRRKNIKTWWAGRDHDLGGAG